MNILIIYSSVTGNTKFLAQSITSHKHNITCLAVEQAKHRIADISGYDIVFLGFWVYRGKPDPRTIRIMKTLKNTKTAVFGTLAAYPDSPHARRVLAFAKECLQNTLYLGDFLCLGKLTEKRLSQKMQAGHNSKHPMTDERKQRLLEGQNHPNLQDCRNFQTFFETVLAKAEHSTANR